MANELLKYVKTGSVFEDACNIIETAQKVAYSAVDLTFVHRNWLLGKRIADEELNGESRAEYGAEVIKKLSKDLNAQYGRGYTKTNLYNFDSFYKMYPEIFHSESGKSNVKLSWTHYRVLIQVKDEIAREWYENEALMETWSAKLEFIKNPIIAEFLGMREDTSYLESDLEQCIIDNLQKFLMELGKGYAFVARQQHIHTEKEDYYIDLVFYNYILKCFVLIDLKTTKITHQDVGQMDMYIRMYDDLKKGSDDNPTLGIVLCSDTDEDIAKYSILHDHGQLFASKYKLYLPTEEELKAEIETQKEMFYLTNQELE